MRDGRALSRGCLFLLVGPSGVGKDAILEALERDGPSRDLLDVARRYVTRPDGVGTEKHVALTLSEFRAARAQGQFLLAWEAHGNGYGIGLEVERKLAAGRSVIANVSRQVIDEARGRLQPLRVLYVTAHPHTVRQRLLARGRESAAQIERRLQRPNELALNAPDVHVIANDGPLDATVAALLPLLLAVLPS